MRAALWKVTGRAEGERAGVKSQEQNNLQQAAATKESKKKSDQEKRITFRRQELNICLLQGWGAVQGGWGGFMIYTSHKFREKKRDKTETVLGQQEISDIICTFDVFSPEG